MRPKLPSVDRLAPYLRSIDASRVYSNFGPLALSLEDRLAEHYGLNQGTVATVSNATLGLAIALAVQQPPPGSLCAMPAWTFVASAHAASMAGLVPYFVDVDPETWALDPNKLFDEIARAPASVGAVMPVMPFGLPLDIAVWEAFRSRTGLAVVIDAAAAFDSLVPGTVPSVVSLHATKVLGAGEGGFVISTDAVHSGRSAHAFKLRLLGQPPGADRSFQCKAKRISCGCRARRVGRMGPTRVEWCDAASAYRHALGKSNQVSLQQSFGETWVGSTCLLGLLDPAADRIEQSLADCGIETRRWWGAGAHAHPANVSFARTALAVTDALARSTLAVPFYRDIGAAEITRVAESVVAAAEARY